MEPKITGYLTANTGFLLNASNDTMFMSTAGVGGMAENNGFYAKAEAGSGTATYAKLETGKNFAFGDSDWALNTSIGGQYTVKHKKRDYYGNIFKEGGNSPEWHSNDMRGYANIGITYNSEYSKVSFGVRVAAKTSTQPSLDGITLEKVGQIINTEHAGKSTKRYIVPRLELEAGKKLRFNLNASFDEVQIGGKLYF